MKPRQITSIVVVLLLIGSGVGMALQAQQSSSPDSLSHGADETTANHEVVESDNEINTLGEVRDRLADAPNITDATGIYQTTIRENGSVIHKYIHTRTLKFTKNHTLERRVYTSPAKKAGQITVSNATTTVQYYPTKQTAYSEQTSHPRPDYLSLFDNATATYQGTKTVDDRTTHVVKFVSTRDKLGNRTTTVYFDANHWIPLQKYTTVTLADGTTYEYHSRWTAIRVDTGISRDRFAFQAPSGVSVEQRPDPPEHYQSLEALRSNTTITVPEPDLPSAFEFDFGRKLTRQEQTMIRYSYTDNETSVLFAIFVNSSTTVRNGTTTTINGQNATYRTKQDGAVVSWKRDNRIYRVNQLDEDERFDRESLLEIATSFDNAINQSS